MLRHTMRHALVGRPEEVQIDRHAVIVPTVDGDYMIIVNGFQIGGQVDRSGAGDATFETIADARAFYQTWRR